MCTGFEIAALGLAIAGTATTLYAQDTAEKAEAAQAQINADQAAADAAAAKGAAEVEAARIRKQKRKDQAAAIAAAAASGVDVSSPTALRITEEIGRDAEEDAIMTIFNGADASARLKKESGAYLTQKANIKSAGKINQTSTLLGGANRVASYGGDAWKRARDAEAG